MPITNSKHAWTWHLSGASCPHCSNFLRIALHPERDHLEAIKCPTCRIRLNVIQIRDAIRTLHSMNATPSAKAVALTEMINCFTKPIPK